MINKLIKKNLINFAPYVSARNLYTKGILLDANENPFNNGLNRYPDPSYKRLKSELAKYARVKSENIFIGAGSDEVLDLIVRLFVENNQEVIIFTPTYGMYEVISKKNGVKLLKLPLNKKFQISKKAFLKNVSSKTKLVFICSPNNPTGNLIDRNDVIEICKKFKGIVVVDEAYIEYSKSKSLSYETKYFQNLIVVRTLSKAWGLAGIRLGYAIADKNIINYLEKIRFPYNINTLTENYALNGLKNKSVMLSNVNKIIYEREKLLIALKNLDLTIYPTQANFIFIKCKNADKIVNILAIQFGIIVRGFGDYIRITVGLPVQNKKLINSLTQIL